MLKKTIKQVITKKIKAWTETITDVKVVEAINKDLIITGGCFPSLMENDEPNDYDCYLRTKKSLLLVANYYAKVWGEQDGKKSPKVVDCSCPSDSEKCFVTKCDGDRIKLIFESVGVQGDPEEANGSEELGVDKICDTIEEIDEVEADKIIKKEKKPYHPVFISSNAITLSDDIQIVVRFHGEPDKVHETFDFLHTRAYYDCGKKELSIPAEVYEAVMNKTLSYTGSLYPLCSLFRLRKFIARGWKINAGQILKISLQVSELDLMDIDVLADQLVGVDSLYFMNLIEIFKKKQEGGDFKLTSNYVVSIIDKIF